MGWSKAQQNRLCESKRNLKSDYKVNVPLRDTLILPQSVGNHAMSARYSDLTEGCNFIAFIVTYLLVGLQVTSFCLLVAQSLGILLYRGAIVHYFEPNYQRN